MELTIPRDLETTFQTALHQTAPQTRHLLLGNGFSIAAYSGFRYGRLIDKAYELHTWLKPMLQELGATDFEDAMARAPDEAAREVIREAFVGTICEIHPRRDEALKAWRRACCAEFLTHFLIEREGVASGKVFTTNYDLLFCWIIVEHLSTLSSFDGFDAQLKWFKERSKRAHYYYLHGALHLYSEPVKSYFQTYKHKAGPYNSSPLPDQIRAFVSSGRFPLIVSEGSWREKTVAIRRPEYEYTNVAFRELRSACSSKNSCLFVVGHSLSTVDKHITNLLGTSGLSAIYIGVHDQGDVDRALTCTADWEILRTQRSLPKLSVHLFRSAEANIWGPPDLSS